VAYPSDSHMADVLGVSIDGDTQAYRVLDLTSREVANDVVAGVSLAATY